MNPKGIIIHHTLTEDGRTVSANPIYDYHVDVNHWKAVGYHAIIELVGPRYWILQGRMDNEMGAHCMGFNDYLGIAIVGNLDKTEVCPAEMELLKKWCRAKIQIYGFKVPDVLGHWETYSLRKLPVEKTCPGLKFNMIEFRKSL